jgi:murein DD-endopeptidase MepM/ murein hydrolase activator NlpD
VAAAAALAVVLGGCRELPPPTEASPSGLATLTEAECLARAVFPPPETSDYCLPVPEGASTVVSQAYCSEPGRSHESRLAYDFDCEPGDPLVAARGGFVEVVGEEWPDDDQSPGHENRVVIRHDDGSVAFYAHFQEQGVEVQTGETVSTGQLLGRCGSSGTHLPHLHFEVFERALYDWDHELPVGFRNAGGPLDSRGGLTRDAVFVALPCA